MRARSRARRRTWARAQARCRAWTGSPCILGTRRQARARRGALRTAGTRAGAAARRCRFGDCVAGACARRGARSQANEAQSIDSEAIGPGLERKPRNITKLTTVKAVAGPPAWKDKCAVGDDDRFPAPRACEIEIVVVIGNCRRVFKRRVDLAAKGDATSAIERELKPVIDAGVLGRFRSVQKGRETRIIGA